MSQNPQRQERTGDSGDSRRGDTLHPEDSHTDDPLVQVQNLQTHYEDTGVFPDPPVKAVDGVSFSLERGETLGLVGESGCGKTTLGRTLVGLEHPTDGTVLFDGADISSLSGAELGEWRQRVSVVFQNPESSLNDRLTVGKIVREPLDVHDWKTPEKRRERVRTLLDRVGLQREHYYRYPHQFSGGQRQRVAIARALAPNPDFIVLDEPVSALDVSVQAKVLNLLADLQAEFGLTYLFIAHDLSVVEHISDRVAVMYLGNIAEIGRTEAVFERPQHPYTHALLSAVPDAELGNATERITLRGTPPSPADPPTGCPFSTRCPMKIQPEDRVDLTRDGWAAVQELRSVLSERESGIAARVRGIKARLGLAPRQEPASKVVDRLTSEYDIPEQVRADLQNAAALFDDGDSAAALALLEEEFHSVCDGTVPAATTHGDGHRSYCHRHEESYRDVESFREEVLDA